ncbi:MAG: metalloprotease [Candidatus Woesearchaeota archaeon]|jgi:Zn-dependent protease
MRNKIEIHKKEAWEITKAWIAISLAFTIILASPLVNKVTLTSLLIYFGIALVTVGLGFLFHEIGHKLVAQRYKCQAEFKADNLMLLLALAMSFLGFVFAAPGAVYIKGYINRVQQGLIALAGPLMNIILALAFLPGMILFTGTLGLLFSYGFIVNSWLGLFNMIPVGNFDGFKIYKWNKKIYYSAAILLLIMTTFGMLW